MNARETVVRLAARGDGVTESGRFVPGTAPGDIVCGDVIESGPHHAQPPCRHFGTCGGCQLQHVDETALADFVTGRIIGALAGVGIAPETVHAAHLSPPAARRRASFRAVHDAGGFRLGFNVDRSSEVVDLAECHVVTHGIWAAAQALREVLPALLPKGSAAGITLTEVDSGFDLLLSNVDAAPTDTLARFAERHGIARIATENGIVVQLAEPVVEIDGVSVALPPGGFLQATRDGELALQAAVVRACEGAKSVADLFCGVGTFALPLSRTARVLAADGAGPAVAALTAAARRAGRRIQTEHRDLFRRPYDARELDKVDAVVLDPPRGGASAQIARLAKSRVKRIVYVSCNPNTFARDAKALAEGDYRLRELWPVGQFRWSTHVELVGVFDK